MKNTLTYFASDFTRKPVTNPYDIERYYITAEIILNLDDEKAEAIIEMIGNHLYTLSPAEHKSNYNRLYRFARSHGLTVLDLVNWYCIE